MDLLKGSLQFIPLPVVTEFIAGLGSTGRLEITQGIWSGEISLATGQVVGARLGDEHGRAALEGLVLALTEAQFAFVDATEEGADQPLMSRDELAACMAELVAEREKLQAVRGRLGSVPCLVDQPQSGEEASQVTIHAAALQLLPALVHGHTLEQIAQRRGLARTLREMTMLCDGGLVRLESAPPPKPAAAAEPEKAPRAAPSAADQAASPRSASTRGVPTVRPLRPFASEPRPAPQPPRRGGWWRAPSASAAASAAPARVEQPRPRLITEAPRPQLEVVCAKPEELEEPRVTPLVARARSWGTTLIGIFVEQA
jgi:hypothetical protein